MNLKIEKLREEMSISNLDGLIIENPINIRYLTGLTAEGTLIINEKENIFITDSRYIEDVNQTLTLDDEINILNVVDLTENDYLIMFQGCDRVGFEEQFITYSNYNKMIIKYRLKEAVETEQIVERLRTIKDQTEIENIETACNITDSCFLYLQEFIKPGMTERQIDFEIKKFFLENGADGEAFETIVASGINTSKPHSTPTNKIIENGDPILIDFGAKYKGYCADMTRTFFVGYVTEEVRKLYDLVLKTQERAFSKMKNDADARVIANNVKNEFYFNKFDLIHALGHGVGLEVHESPILSTRCNCTLKENMVVTNEPGIYIPGKLGIRIEDTVLINNMTATNLTKSNKNLIVI